MLTIMQSIRTRGSAGEPIPNPFRSLSALDAEFRRGQYVIIAGPPGTGKSGVALTLALKSGVPGMYFSADSDKFTQSTRAISILTDKMLDESAEMVRAGDISDVADELSSLSLRFEYSASPTIDQIQMKMKSWFAVYEDFPDFIIVDNISNVILEGDDGESLETLNDLLHDMARETQSCVIGLHHVTGAYNDANKPIPLSGVKGQIGRVPEMILTLSKNVAADLQVSVVKNRSARADPSGELYAVLHFDGDRMSIKDYV